MAVVRLGRAADARDVVEDGQLLTCAGKREDSADEPLWSYHDNLKRFGARPLVCPQDRHEASRVEEAETLKVKHDPPGLRRRDALQGSLDATDARLVELPVKCRRRVVPCCSTRMPRWQLLDE